MGPDGRCAAYAPPARTGGDHSRLELSVRQVLLDQELLDRVVRAIQLYRREGYMAAIDVLHCGGAESLLVALERAQVDADFVEAALSALATLDVAARKAHERTSKRVVGERVDGLGRVRFDGGIEAATGPEQRELRLTRTRQAAPGQFEGENGRIRFLELDRQHLAAGLDMVRTLERAIDIRMVRSHPSGVAAHVVLQISAEEDAWERLSRLEAKIDELRGPVVDLEDVRTTSAGRQRSRPARPQARRRPRAPATGGHAQHAGPRAA